MADAKWARAYLHGRAGGYVNGTLTAAMLVAAIRKALTSGLSRADIAHVLAEHHLAWDPTTDSITRVTSSSSV